MTVRNISFEQAIAETEGKRRHILLGNGFSIAGYSKFAYRSLAAEACEIDREMVDIFARFDTVDFERAMACAETEAIRARIRRAFIESIARIHPTRDRALSPLQRNTCAKFLTLFHRTDSDFAGNIFTTNYDIMLYWVLMSAKSYLACHDGFDAKNIWNPARIDRSSVFYLHGGLHIYKIAGRQPTGKLKAGISSMNLVEEIQAYVRAGNFPIMVSERSRDAKENAIRAHEDYLYPVFKKFHSTCKLQDDVLFTYGHSLSDVDGHVVSSIARGKIKQVYISAFSSYDGERVENLSREWSELRRAKDLPPINVAIYPAADTPVWNSK